MAAAVATAMYYIQGKIELLITCVHACVMTRQLSTVIFCDIFDSVSMVHSDFFTLWLA